MLKEKFKNYHEFEEYDNFITSCEVLLTSSPQAVLECLASGGKPTYIQRNDYSKDFLEKFKELNIPIIMDYKREEILKIIKSIHNWMYAYKKVHIYSFVDLYMSTGPI